MFNLEGKNAFVSGASRGLGRQFANALAKAGANIVITSRTLESLETTKQEIEALGRKCIEIEMEVLKEDSIVNAVKRAEAELGPISILVNNAGTNIPEHFLTIRKQDMEKVVKINTIAAFNVANLVALKMVQTTNRKKIGGAIVNMSSQMGHVGGPIRSVYNMTKFGFEGLTKAMSIDLAKHNISVNTVCPTFVVTPMTSKFLKDKKFMREVLANIPLGRFA